MSDEVKNENLEEYPDTQGEGAVVPEISDEVVASADVQRKSTGAEVRAVLTREELKQDLEAVTNSDELREWLTGFLYTLRKLPFSQLCMKIAKADEEKIFNGREEGILEEFFDSESDLEKTKADICEYLDSDEGKESFTLSLDIPLTDENVARLTELAELIEFGEIEFTDLVSPYFLKSKTRVIKDLFDRETNGGQRAEDYLASLDLDAFKGEEGRDGYDKYVVIKFWNMLTPQGVETFNLLKEFGINPGLDLTAGDFYNSYNSEIIKSLMPLKRAGVNVSDFRLSRFKEYEKPFDPADIEVVGEIFGGEEGLSLWPGSLERMKGISEYSFDDSSIKGIRIMVVNETFNWWSKMKYLIGIKEHHLSFFEANLRGIFYSDFHLEENLGILFASTPQEIDLVSKFQDRTVLKDVGLSMLDLLRNIREAGIEGLTDEQVDRACLTLSIFHIDNMRAQDFFVLLKKIQRLEVGDDDYKNSMGSLKACIKNKYRNISMVQAVDWIRFMRGGYPKWKKLLDADMLITDKYPSSSDFNRDACLVNIVPDDQVKNSKVAGRYFNEDLHTNVEIAGGITDVADEKIDLYIKIKALVPNLKVVTIPDNINEYTEEVFERLTQRREKMPELFDSITGWWQVHELCFNSDEVIENAVIVLKAIDVNGYSDKVFRTVIDVAEIEGVEKKSLSVYGEIIGDSLHYLNRAWDLVLICRLLGDDIDRTKELYELNGDQIKNIASLIRGYNANGDVLDEATFEKAVLVSQNSVAPVHVHEDSFQTWCRDEGKEGQNPKEMMHSYLEEYVCLPNKDLTAKGELKNVFRLFPDLDFSSGITEKNAFFALIVYANISGWENPDTPLDEDVVSVRKMVKERVEEGKDIILGVLNGIRNSAGGINDDSVSFLRRAGISKLHDVGILHYRVIERTSDYVNLLLSEVPEEIKGLSGSLLKKFSTRSRVKEQNLRYSHDDYLSFYEKCMSVASVDHVVLQNILACFDSLALNKENYRFMQEEFFKNFAVLSILGGHIGKGEDEEGGYKKRSEDLLEKLMHDLEVEEDSVGQRKLLEGANEVAKDILLGVFEKGLGLKNLPDMENVDMGALSPYLVYLSNIHNVDDEKKSIISFFVLLSILGKWEEFKAGEDIDVSGYFSSEVELYVQKYLKERKEFDIFNEGDGIDEKWMKVLNEKEEKILLGESSRITDVLDQVEKNYADLEDSDNFSEVERMLLVLVRKHGQRNVGKALAMRYRNPEYTDDVIEDLPLDSIEDEKVVLPDWQKLARIMGSLAKFCDEIGEANLAERVHLFDQVLSPSAAVITVFRSIGEEMETDSGAKPVTEDVEYLEGLLNKKRDQIGEDNYALANVYIEEIKKHVLELNEIRDSVAKKFDALEESLAKADIISDVFRSRIGEFKKLFKVEESDKRITLRSTMTGDLRDVIQHIRQCLGCQSQECNNDTNLTFGDRNRFLLLTREFQMKDDKSFSDELVTVQETKDVVEGEEVEYGEKTYSFIMDNVYGNRSRDVLISNVLTVLAKLKALKKASPKVSIDVFVTNSALSSCGVSEEYLKDKIASEFGKAKVDKGNKLVTIAKSASGDGHYEIGGGFGGREAGGVERSVPGIKVSL